MKKIGWWITLSLLILACDKSEEPGSRGSDREYFPLAKGDYRIYSVETIRYTLSVPETISFQLKEVISDSFTNDEGGTSYVLQRYRRTGEGPWVSDETWLARMRNNEAILSEGNIPFVVLTFPLEEGRNWNGNAYNAETLFYTDHPEDEYRIVSLDETVELAGQIFTECVVVGQEDEEDLLLYKDFRKAVYARNVGLVKKELIQLKYCTSTGTGCLGQQVVEEGVIINQNLLEYGR